MMTRCEAYLDSKGILRPWRKDLERETLIVGRQDDTSVEWGSPSFYQRRPLGPNVSAAARKGAAATASIPAGSP